MANLLYAEYNTGCYVAWFSSDVYEPEDYCYGDSSEIASYYADLEPNTTYTIQRIDTTARFRVALSSQDLKYLSATTYTEVQSPFSWGYRADSSNPITFTTGDTNTHLVVYYTNNSEYNTKVMLNEGSSVEPYEASTRYFKDHWYLVDGELTNNKLPEPIDSNLAPPYPASLWRFDSDDILTLNNEDWSPFPEPLAYFTPPYPASVWYLDEHDLLVNGLLPEPIDSIFTYPYPASLWWYDSSQGRLREVLQPAALPLGAFANCRRLEYMKIPENVKSLGGETFKKTNLIEVTIADDCTYSSETFPPGCQVKYYSD